MSTWFALRQAVLCRLGTMPQPARAGNGEACRWFQRIVRAAGVGSGPTAVDREDLSGDPAGCGRREEGDRPGDVVGGAEAAGEDRLQKTVLSVGAVGLPLP